MQDRLSRFLGLRQGLVFDSRSAHSGRDIAWLGDCDTGCQLLADKLGWGVKLAHIPLFLSLLSSTFSRELKPALFLMSAFRTNYELSCKENTKV